MSAAYKCDSCGTLFADAKRLIVVTLPPWNSFHVGYATGQG